MNTVSDRELQPFLHMYTNGSNALWRNPVFYECSLGLGHGARNDVVPLQRFETLSMSTQAGFIINTVFHRELEPFLQIYINGSNALGKNRVHYTRRE